MIIRYLIDKPQQAPGIAAFLGVHLGAFRALAGLAPIVLGNGKNGGFRVLLDFLAQPFGHNPQHIRVGQAQLRIHDVHAAVHIFAVAAVEPLTVHHREVFGMLIKKLKDWHKMIECMDKSLVQDGAAVLLVQLITAAIHPLGRELVVVVAYVPKYLTVLKGRDHRLVHFPDRQVRPLRHVLHRIREEPAPQHVLQKGVRRMQHRPVVLAQDEQPVPHRLQDVSVVLQARDVRLAFPARLPHADLRRVLVPDGPPARRVDRQVRSRHLVEIAG